MGEGERKLGEISVESGSGAVEVWGDRGGMKELRSEGRDHADDTLLSSYGSLNRQGLPIQRE